MQGTLRTITVLVLALALVGLSSVVGWLDRWLVTMLANHGRYIGPVLSFVVGALVMLAIGWEHAAAEAGDAE